VSTRGGSSSSTTNSSTALNSAVATEAAAAAAAPVEYFRNDYEPLTNIVTKISMNFDIHDGKTTVTSKMNIEENPNGLGAGDLVLDGDETSVALMKLTLDGRELEEGKDYELVPGKLIVKKEAFQGNDGSGLLETVVEIVPEDNTKLSGKF
jgi:aminopeptidase N